MFNRDNPNSCGPHSQSTSHRVGCGSLSSLPSHPAIKLQAEAERASSETIPTHTCRVTAVAAFLDETLPRFAYAGPRIWRQRERERERKQSRRHAKSARDFGPRIARILVSIAYYCSPANSLPRGSTATVAYSPAAAAQATTSSNGQVSSSHRRRTSRGLHAPPAEGLRTTPPSTTATSSSIPFIEEADDDVYTPSQRGLGGLEDMSLDRSPSPSPRGGWSSPGLTTPFSSSDTMTSHSRSHTSSPAGARKHYGDLHSGANGNGGLSWATAKAKSARVNGYVPSFDSHEGGSGGQGFFAKHARRLSEALPMWSHGGQEDRFAEKEKLGRGRSSGRAGWFGGSGGGWKDLPRRIARMVGRRRRYVGLALIAILAVLVWFQKRKWKFVKVYGGGVERMGTAAWRLCPVRIRHIC